MRRKDVMYLIIIIHDYATVTVRKGYISQRHEITTERKLQIVELLIALISRDESVKQYKRIQ